jgi:hypothetical protein
VSPSPHKKGEGLGHGAKTEWACELYLCIKETETKMESSFVRIFLCF